jgi:8-oxo-dGTP diphosphatase
VRVLLVRHGHAGTKEGWTGDDRLRPLDARGRRQAAHLSGVIAPLGPTRIVSSPYLRCLETMEPLAGAVGATVERDEALTPDAAARAVVLVRRLSRSASSDGVVLCTHGEVMGEVLAVLVAEDGVRLRRRAPGLKGCTWVIEFEQGRAVKATYIAPRR